MRILAAALLLGSIVATPALAQDVVEKAPFTGGHIEAIGGVDHVSANGEGATGGLYGVSLGYDFQAGGAVIGIEGEANDATTKDCERGFIVANDRFCLKSGRDLYAGARVGVVTGNTLIYAKAGYTNAREVAQYTGTTAASNFRVADNLDGARVGAGVEFTAGQLLIKAEYRYSNYEADFSRHQGVVGVGVRF